MHLQKEGNTEHVNSNWLQGFQVGNGPGNRVEVSQQKSQLLYLKYLLAF